MRSCTSCSSKQQADVGRTFSGPIKVRWPMTRSEQPSQSSIPGMWCDPAGGSETVAVAATGEAARRSLVLATSGPPHCPTFEGGQNVSGLCFCHFVLVQRQRSIMCPASGGKTSLFEVAHCSHRRRHATNGKAPTHQVYGYNLTTSFWILHSS
jgi:hypothetical protein